MTEWTYEHLTRLTLDYAVPDEAIEDRRERKARRILRAATELFLRFGYGKTSIDDVARAAAVGKGTVYLYFTNKAELLLHCILLEKASPAKRLMAQMQDLRTPQEHLRHTVHAGFDVIHDMPLVSRLSRGDHEMTVVLDDLGVGFRALMRSAQVEHFARLLRPIATVDDDTLGRIIRTLLTLLRAAPNVIEELDDLGLQRVDHAAAMTDILVAGVLDAIGAPR